MLVWFVVGLRKDKSITNHCVVCGAAVQYELECDTHIKMCALYALMY